jgi:hypothetical protein
MVSRQARNLLIGTRPFRCGGPLLRRNMRRRDGPGPRDASLSLSRSSSLIGDDDAIDDVRAPTTLRSTSRDAVAPTRPPDRRVEPSVALRH